MEPHHFYYDELHISKPVYVTGLSVYKCPNKKIGMSMDLRYFDIESQTIRNLFQFLILSLFFITILHYTEHHFVLFSHACVPVNG